MQKGKHLVLSFLHYGLCQFKTSLQIPCANLPAVWLSTSRFRTLPKGENIVLPSGARELLYAVVLIYFTSSRLAMGSKVSSSGQRIADSIR